MPEATQKDDTQRPVIRCVRRVVKCTERCLTVKETVVFEAASAEEGVKRMQRLLPLRGLGEGPVYVGGAQGGQLHRAGRLQEVFVSAQVGGDE